MPVNISDVNVWTTPVTAPDDGDLADGATFQDPIQDLANRTYYNKLRLDELYGGTVALTEPLIINDFDVTIEEDLTVSGSASVGGALAVTGDITCDDLTVGDDLTVTDNITCQDITVTESIIGALVNGRFRFETGTGPDADTTFSADTDEQVQITTTMSADRDYTFDNTGANAGDFFVVKNQIGGGGGGWSIELKDDGGSNIAFLANGDTGIVIFFGGEWRLLIHCQNP